ncbi:MAG: FecR family protein [Dysgonomonas sp.]
MLSILDSTNINIEQVQIVSGDNKAYVDNGTISQTQDGDVVVNSEEKLKSSDIKTEFLQLLVPNGKKTKVEFSDGTKVWVNSGSKLMYPKVFADNRREIYLDGEIYIEVAKDKSKPFIVHTKKLDVKVLGTKFNVCSYNSETDNSVILVDGRVKVLTDNNGKKELSPNQGFFYDGQTFSVKTVDTYPYICWKDGRMNLKGESLDYIFKRLSRYYNLKFNYDARKATDKFKGNLDLDAPIEDILNNLSLTVPFTYSLNNNVINITIL